MNLTVGEPMNSSIDYNFRMPGSYADLSNDGILINVTNVYKFHIKQTDGSILEYPGMNITIPKDFNQTCVKESILTQKACYETFENGY